MKRSKYLNMHTDSEGSWAISYGDMITLLLSFFVIFFSFDFNKEKELKLQESAIRDIATTENDLKENALMNNDEVIDDLTTIKSDSKGRIFVVFKNMSFFTSGSTDVRTNAKVVLDQFVEKYMPYSGKYKIKVQAFTDSTPVTRKRRYRDNIELSALRSISVLRYLTMKGIPKRRIEIGGKGILSSKARELFGIQTEDKEKLKELSRTIAIVLYREDAV